MRITVVYDSAYGNTARVAQAIGEALRSAGEVEVRLAHDLTPEGLITADVLVVGSPTQRFRPTEPLTRLLSSIPSGGLRGVRVAAFDTRLDMKASTSSMLKFFVRRAGESAYAAPHLARALSEHGGTLLAPPEGFIVEGTEGPLRVGELERAAGWARSLLSEQKFEEPIQQTAARQDAPTVRPWTLLPLSVSLGLLAVGALYGGLSLVSAPDGHLLGLSPAALDPRFFHGYLVPGLVLLCLFGLGSLATLALLWTRFWPARRLRVPGVPHEHWAWSAAFLLGVGQVIWIGVELAVLSQRFPLLQWACATLGMLIAGLTLLPTRRSERRKVRHA